MSSLHCCLVECNGAHLLHVKIGCLFSATTFKKWSLNLSLYWNRRATDFSHSSFLSTHYFIFTNRKVYCCEHISNLKLLQKVSEQYLVDCQICGHISRIDIIIAFVNFGCLSATVTIIRLVFFQVFLVIKSDYVCN